MDSHRLRFTLGVSLLTLVFGLALSAQTMDLHQGWAIESSAQVTASPAEISSPGFAASGWSAATVPTTVFSNQVEHGVFPNPDYGMNLRQVPGVEYKIGANYANQDIPASSPYAVPWWYRTEFTLPASFKGKTLWLDFHGLNYRANIWLNGHPIASADTARGTFRRYEFNVTDAVHATGANALALEIYAPEAADLALTYVDWNPMPPDKDMGIWQKVVLRASGPVALRHAWIRSEVSPPAANVTVSADLINTTDREQRGTLRGRLGNVAFSRAYTLAPHQQQTAVFTPADTHALRMAHPRLWWPYDMGKPNLYPLTLEFVQTSGVSDSSRQQVGIDQVTSRLNAQGSKQFYVNGRPFYVRGGGWTSGMMLRDGVERWKQDLAYVKAMHLNTIRSEGKLVDTSLIDLADRDGVMVMIGWSCCDHWQDQKLWHSDELKIATASLRDQILRLRGHASILVWLNGSDRPPLRNVEKAYLDVEHQLEWSRPLLSSATAKNAQYSGPSGVKMSGPYDYVPPMYWQAAPQLGGARGFNTETSAGAAIPPVESLKRFIPADHLWSSLGPLDPYWSFHAASGNFSSLHRFTDAMNARYGKATSLEDYERKAQAMTYAGERAMFEAYGRRQGEATGVVQWMLNNGWPSVFWHLYDFYLVPDGGFYGAKLANEPLHIQYSGTDRAISIVDHQIEPASGLRVSATVYDLDGKQLYTHQQSGLSVAAQSSSDAFKVPSFPNDIFLNLVMTDAHGHPVSHNFYWLSDKPDVLDVKRANWYYTPLLSTADFTPMQHLPEVLVEVKSSFRKAGAEGLGTVTLTNPTSHIAFMVRARILQGPGGEDVVPIFWSDNYVSLLPHQTRTLRVHYDLKDLDGKAPTVAVSGWNLRGNGQ